MTGGDLTRRNALTTIGAAGATMAVATSAAAVGPGRGATLATAFEALRVAMVEGDGAVLDRLFGARLIYMHSSGHAQTKQNLLNDLAGKRFFASLANLEPTYEVVDRTGIVTATVDQVKNLPGGKTRASRIKIMQTWVLLKGEWVLTARLSSIISSPLSSACRTG